MRTGKNDKDLIGDEAFKAEQNLTALQALIKFALHQIEHSPPEEFIAWRDEWSSMLRLMREKIDVCYESNAEIGYLAATYVLPKTKEPVSEARH